MKKDRGFLDSPTNVRFEDLVSLCTEYFGVPRIRGSHYIFKTPWQGDPRLNLQKDGPKAKPYQVKQVRKAIERRDDEHGKSD